MARLLGTIFGLITCVGIGNYAYQSWTYQQFKRGQKVAIELQNKQQSQSAQWFHSQTGVHYEPETVERNYASTFGLTRVVIIIGILGLVAVYLTKRRSDSKLKRLADDG